jgi:hypothetical protein
MKKLAVLLIGSLLLISSAQATVYTFEYTAKISSISETVGNNESTGLLASTVARRQINLGDSVSGIFTIDTNSTPTPGDVYTLYGPDSQNKVTSAIGTDGLTTASTDAASTVQNSLYVFPATGFGSQLTISTVTFKDSIFEAARIDFESIFSIDATGIPVSLVSLLNTATFTYTATNTASDIFNQIDASGELVSLKQISAVPEPATYAMLLFGLALVAGRARRARG